MLGGAGCWAEREEDEGEWAYERKKRAEVAVAKARAQNLAAGRAVAGRVVSMIHLDEGAACALPFKSSTTRFMLRAFGGLGRKRSVSH